MKFLFTSKMLLAPLLMFLMVAGYANAQTQTNIRPSTTSNPYNVILSTCSIIIGQTNVPQLLLPANISRKFLSFQVQQIGTNPVPSIGFSYTSSVPAFGTEDTFTLSPLAIAGHEGNTVPTNAIWVVGPAGTVISCVKG